MAEEKAKERSRGKVVRFSARKGFGFIKPDDGGDDLFVHYTAIKTNGSDDGGYRSLNEDDVVEFTVVLSEEDKYQAVDVAVISNSNKRGGDGLGRRSGGGVRRSNGNAGGGCYNCGESGHIARDCNNNINNNNRRGNSNGECFKCGNTGHFARDCNARVNNGGGSCYSCGGYGHLARDCPGGTGACFNCGGFGHLARECPSARVGGGGGRSAGGRGGSRVECFNCRSEGHIARDCRNQS